MNGNEIRITIPVRIDEPFLKFLRDHAVGEEGVEFLRGLLDKPDRA